VEIRVDPTRSGIAMIRITDSNVPQIADKNYNVTVSPDKKSEVHWNAVDDVYRALLLGKGRVSGGVRMNAGVFGDLVTRKFMVAAYEGYWQYLYITLDTLLKTIQMPNGYTVGYDKYHFSASIVARNPKYTPVDVVLCLKQRTPEELPF
jgi:hypothetical protein